MKSLQGFFVRLLHLPRLSLAVALVTLCLFCSYIPSTRTVDNIDYFFPEDDDAAFKRHFERTFVGDEFFIIAFEEEEIFTQENLELIRKLSDAIQNFEEVREVKSLATIDRLHGGEDFFEVNKFLRDIPPDPAALLLLKEEAVSDPLYVNNVISADGKTASIVVFAREGLKDPGFRRSLLDKTQALLGRFPAHAFHLGGWTVTNYALSNIVRHDMALLVPLSYAFVCLTLLVIFRNARLMLLGFVNMSACLCSTIGFFGITGTTYNNITCAVLPLAITLSLADTIHLFSHMDRAVLRRFPTHREALASIVGSIIVPCLMTSITTGLGFLSLAVSSIPALRDFALMSSAAMVFEFFYSFLLLPPLILFFDPEKTYLNLDMSRGTHMNRFLQTLWCFVRDHCRGILVAGSMLAILGAWFTCQVRIESDVIEYFKSASSFRQDIDFVQSRIGGVMSLEVSIRADKEDAFKHPEILRLLDNLEENIKSVRGVDVTTSFLSFLKEMNKSFHNEDKEYYRIPDSEAEIEQYLLLYDGDDVRKFMTPAFDHARIAVRLSSHNSREEKEILRTIQGYMDGHLQGKGLEVRLTGSAVQYVNVATEMVDGQISSFGTATLVVGILMMCLLRSIGIGLLSLIPNIYPILLNFGIMGLVGINLDTGTIMVASIALGIAVDDTIHFLTKYQAKRRALVPIERAVEEVLLSKGRAIITSSIVLTLGFVVLIFSNFMPIVNLGLLTTLVMFIAMSGDLVLLPAMLVFYRRCTSTWNT